MIEKGEEVIVNIQGHLVPGIFIKVEENGLYLVSYRGICYKVGKANVTKYDDL